MVLGHNLEKDVLDLLWVLNEGYSTNGERIRLSNKLSKLSESSLEKNVYVSVIKKATDYLSLFDGHMIYNLGNLVSEGNFSQEQKDDISKTYISKIGNPDDFKVDKMVRANVLLFAVTPKNYTTEKLEQEHFLRYEFPLEYLGLMLNFDWPTSKEFALEESKTSSEKVLNLLYSRLDSKLDSEKAKDFYYDYKKLKGNSILSQESLRLLSLMEDKFKIQY